MSHPPARRVTRWTPIAWSNYQGSSRQISQYFRVGKLLQRLADRSWELSASTTRPGRRAVALPGQLDRVTGMAYTKDPAADMAGADGTLHAPTTAHLLRDVWLLDGSLYKHAGRFKVVRFDLHKRDRLSFLRKFLPRMKVDVELERASMYSTFDGNEFFGLWLTDDCPNHALAAREGVPVTTTLPASDHKRQYEQWYGIEPLRLEAARFREVVLIDDHWENNDGKAARFADLRQRLLSHVEVRSHPGVFILRRDSGVPRRMCNELELAEQLQRGRGFQVVDVTRDDVPTIVSRCAGARVVVGVEGSHLMHGVVALQPGASVLTLQPPMRFCSVIKRTTDMAGLNFAYVVGRARGGDFEVDPGEVERTLDLLPA